MSNKTKLKGKRFPNTQKTGIGCIGRDEDGEFIFINMKKMIAFDGDYFELMSKISESYKLPKKSKTKVNLTADEKIMFGDVETPIIVYTDTDSPEYLKVSEELKLMKLLAGTVFFFDMDKTIEVDGKDITHWEQYGIKKGDYFGLCKYMISKEGMGIGLGDISLIQSEATRIINSEKTLGQKILDAEFSISSHQESIDKSHQDIIDQIESERKLDESEPDKSE